MRVAANQGIERLRNEIASYFARTHSKTTRAREEVTAALNAVVNGRRHLLEVMTCEDQIKEIGAKHWDEYCHRNQRPNYTKWAANFAGAKNSLSLAN